MRFSQVTIVTAAAAILLLAVTASAKDHNWQTGKVVDTISLSKPINIIDQTVVIADENYTYTAHRTGRWRWTKSTNLTVNAPVKFAVEKRKLFLVDDDGKQYELDVVKRAKN